jgi:phenylacetate-CoA ligase
MSLYSKVHSVLVWPSWERRNGMSTRGHLRFLKSCEQWSAGQLRSFQLDRLKSLLCHAYEHTSFYKKRFDESGFNPYGMNSVEDIKKIEPVTRQDLNEHIQEMIADNIPEKDIHYASTGGSTGLPTRFARDNACLSIKKASEYRFNTWTGWRPGEKILLYWPALADFSAEAGQASTIKSLIYTRRLSLYAGRLNDKILSDHLKAFKSFSPHLVRAFPSAIQRFAEYIRAVGVKIPSPIRGIITVGEPLLESQRSLFREVFQCDVFNCYVSRECGNIACECSAHSGMHVAEELVYLEIAAQQEGQHGEILVTDLWNFGMPFIRYRIQDAARWLKEPCACGKQHRLIGLDAARLSDFLISPLDGSYVSGSTLTHYLLAEGPGVSRVKLIQDAKDHIQIIMAGDEQSNSTGVQHIKERIKTIFQGTMRVDFEFVDSIPLLKSGKYSFVERKF